MNNSTCTVCTHSTFEFKEYPVGSNPPILSHVFSGAKIRICERCGFGELYPMPSEEKLELYYSSFYWESRNDITLTKLPDDRACFQYDKIIQYIDYKKIDRMLEYGPGSANISRTIKHRHKNVTTAIVEKSKVYCELHRSNKTIDHIYENINSVQEKQDLIVSSGSLEHITDTNLVFSEIKRILKKNGVVFIEVPNCKPELYYPFVKFHIPHSLFFTKKAFKKLAESYNFKILSIETLGISWQENETLLENNVYYGHEFYKVGNSYFPNKEGFVLWVVLKNND